MLYLILPIIIIICSLGFIIDLCIYKFGTNVKFLIDAYFFFHKETCFTLLRRCKLSKKHIDFILKNCDFYSINVTDVMLYQKYRFEPKVIIDKMNYSLCNVSYYFENNKLSTEDYIEFLNYDLSYFNYFKNPPKEVVDYYKLMTL